MKNKRFKLEQSQDLPGWWVLTDIDNLIVIKFKEHEFNETQRITVLEESMFVNRTDCANELAHIASEMGNYMLTHYYSIALPVPVFEFRQDDEKERLLLIRNKFPRIVVEINDDCNLQQLSKALSSAAEFVNKYNKRNKNDK